MDFGLTEEQQLLLESLKEIMDREVSEAYFKECDKQHKFPEKLAQALLDNGFYDLGIPEEYGGTPVDTVTMILIAEHICKWGGPHNMFSNSLPISNMLTFGTEEQIKITMEWAKQGKLAFALGFTEPQAGSDTSRIATTYTRKDGKVYINGCKTFITGALDDPYLLCCARNADESDPNKTFTLWFMKLDKPGIKITPIDKIGWHMVQTCDVVLDNVEIEESDMCGQEGMGFVHVMQNFEVERLVMAAYILGMAECAYADAAKYAGQREQFGKTIGSFQLIQEKIVDMAAKIENMRNMVYKCAWQKDVGESLRNSSAIAKRYCAQAGCEVIDDALQVLGGIGYTHDARVSRLWRDARVFRIGGGTDEIMVHVAGRGLIKEALRKS